MEPRNIAVVLLDLGGVVVDVDHERARQAWTRETGRPGEDFDRVFFASGVKYGMDTGAIGATEGFARAAELAGGSARPETVQRCFEAILGVRPGAAALFQELRGKVRVGVVSNTDPTHGAWIEEHGGIRDLVETWTYSFEEGVLKPDPGLLVAALQAMKAEPCATLLIDDRSDNCASARALGMDVIRSENVAQVRAELAQRGLVDA